MDAVQLTLLILGIGITLIPLDWVQSVIFGEDTPITVWTLLVPVIGICMIGAALLSYHKNELRVICYGVLKTIDQTGLGLGIVTDLGGLFSSKRGTTSSVEGFTATSELPLPE
jgi:hypothetical protein